MEEDRQKLNWVYINGAEKCKLAKDKEKKIPK